MNDQRDHLTNKDFLTVEELSREDILTIFRTAELIRAAQNVNASYGYVNEMNPRGKGKITGRYDIVSDAYTTFLRRRAVSLIFSLPSTRTKSATELAVWQSGGYPMMFTGEQSQISRGESVADTIRSLERNSAAFIIRGEDHAFHTEAAKTTDRPVINALSRRSHPAEALAEILTLNFRKHCEEVASQGSSWEDAPSFSFERLRHIRCAYIGDAGNVATSLLHTAAKLEIPFTIASPEGYDCPVEIQVALEGSTVKFVSDPREAIEGAEAIFGDTYVSMGQEAERKEREAIFRPYQVNADLLKGAAKNKAGEPDYVYLHCLPAYRGQEVSAEILDGSRSAAFEISDGRVLIHRALLYLLVSE